MFTLTQLEEAATKADILWTERPSNTMWNFYDCMVYQFNWNLEEDEYEQIAAFLATRS
jgi:hypothetical protein